MFPLFTTRCLHVRRDVGDPSGGSGNYGRECCPVILPKWRFPRHLGIFYMPQIYDANTVYHRIFCMMTDEWEPGLDYGSWHILTYYRGTEVNRVNLSRDDVSRHRFSNPRSFECEVGVCLSRFLCFVVCFVEGSWVRVRWWVKARPSC